MRFSLLCRGGRGRPEAKKAEEIKEYANIFAFFGWKKQAGSKKSRGNQGICEYLCFVVEEEASWKRKKQRKSRNMRISLLCQGRGSKLEVKKAEEIKEYANIFAFSWRKKQAGSEKSRGNQGICEYLCFFVEEEASRK